MFYIISNPVSQSGNKKTAEEILRKALKDKGLPYRFAHTKYKGHGEKLAASVCAHAAEDGEPASLIILGGDGTVNSVLSGITDFSLIRLGVVPVGSGNDFLRGLDAGQNEEDLIGRILENKVRRCVDVGELSCRTDDGVFTRRFGVSAGIGFDAAICEEVERSSVKHLLNKVHLGQLTYGVIGLKQVITAPQISCEIEDDKGNVTKVQKLLFAALMNLPYEGGGYPFAPDAQCSDGRLDIMVADGIGGISALLLFPKAKAGKLGGEKGISYLQCEKATIRPVSPLWFHTDGETFVKTDQLTASVLPQALQLLI